MHHNERVLLSFIYVFELAFHQVHHLKAKLAEFSVYKDTKRLLAN